MTNTPTSLIPTHNETEEFRCSIVCVTFFSAAALVDGHYVGDHYFHRREKESLHQLRLVPVSSQTAAVEEKKQRFVSESL